MALLGLTVALTLLLALNAFFVLAEFAVVKVRPTRVAELVAAGDPRARLLREIQSQLDQYLSVCQVGITLASVALGMVGTTATGLLLGEGDPGPWRHLAAIAFSYVIVSGSHIVLGELVPKSIAISLADKAALWSARPLRLFRSLFFPALWLLSAVANVILRMLGLSSPSGDEHHSESELRIILDRSQELGLLSFRRLLFMENVFDFGELTVRDAMRPRSLVKCLEAGTPWETTRETIRASRFTRYPLLEEGGERPIGFVHLKDLLLRGDERPADLRALARPLLTTQESVALETLLAEMQRRRLHAAVVTDAGGRWTGLITLEDVIEELVGTIRDEFDDEEPTRLADAVTPEAIQLDVGEGTPIAALERALRRCPEAVLPMPAPEIVAAVAARERLVPTYLGHGIGMPHARINGLARPFLMFLRSEEGVTCEGTTERAHLLFVLLTPSGQPRVHQRLQSIIATLMTESGYVKDRLMSAESAEEVLEVLRTGEQAVLD